MEENNTPESSQFAKNLDNFSGLFSDTSGIDYKSLERAAMVAKMLNENGGLFSGTNNETQKEAPDIPEDAGERQIKILNAAIPFLNKEYQKNLFLLVKFMELTRFGNEGVLVAQSERAPENKTEKKIKMVNAIKPYLNTRECHELDLILRTMELRRLIGNDE